MNILGVTRFVFKAELSSYCVQRSVPVVSILNNSVLMSRGERLKTNKHYGHYIARCLKGVGQNTVQLRTPLKWVSC